MVREVEIEAAEAVRKPTRVRVSSGARGRPVAEVVARLEQRNPALARESGLSSSAMRAGDLVRSLRQAIGLSQAALAKRLGVSQARISEIEGGSGTQGPTWDVMERIFWACDASVTVLPAMPGNFAEAAATMNVREPDSGLTWLPVNEPARAAFTSALDPALTGSVLAAHVVADRTVFTCDVALRRGAGRIRFGKWAGQKVRVVFEPVAILGSPTDLQSITATWDKETSGR